MRRLTDEHGALTVTFGLILVAVFLPLMLVVADFGRIVVERRQLQNSADAAAIAVAFDCARSVMNNLPAGCNGAAAQGYADANDSHDSNTNLPNPVVPDQIPPCLDTGIEASCVRVATRSREGTSNSVSLWLAGFFDGDNATAQVDAQATAAWGGAYRASGLALIMNRCLYDTFGGGALLTPEAAALLPDEAAPVIVVNEAYGGCAAFHPSGGHGWIDPTIPPCSVTLFSGINSVDVDTGNDTSCEYPGGNAAQAEAFRNAMYRKVVYIPIASAYAGTGSGSTYDVDGWAAMVVTGWNFSSSFKHNIDKCVPPGNSARCIRGFFVTAPPGSGPVGGDDLGVQNVQLIK